MFQSLERLKRCRFLQTAPLRKKDLLVRGPTTWSRASDKQTQIYPEDLEHESEIVTKLAGRHVRGNERIVRDIL